MLPYLFHMKEGMFWLCIGIGMQSKRLRSNWGKIMKKNSFFSLSLWPQRFKKRTSWPRTAKSSQRMNLPSPFSHRMGLLSELDSKQQRKRVSMAIIIWKWGRVCVCEWGGHIEGVSSRPFHCFLPCSPPHRSRPRESNVCVRTMGGSPVLSWEAGECVCPSCEESSWRGFGHKGPWAVAMAYFVHTEHFTRTRGNRCTGLRP